MTDAWEMRQAETGLTPGPVWRDRGIIINTLTERNQALEERVAELEGSCQQLRDDYQGALAEAERVRSNYMLATDAQRINYRYAKCRDANVALARRAEAAEAREAALRARIEALVSALERTEANFRLAVQGKPVRDMAENLAENRAALAPLQPQRECHECRHGAHRDCVGRNPIQGQCCCACFAENMTATAALAASPAEDATPEPTSAVFHQNPGRWCDVCKARGWHHTDRHDEFTTSVAEPQAEDMTPTEQQAQGGAFGAISRMTCECCAPGCDCGCVEECPAPACRKFRPAPVADPTADTP